MAARSRPSSRARPPVSSIRAPSSDWAPRARRMPATIRPAMCALSTIAPPTRAVRSWRAARRWARRQLPVMSRPPAPSRPRRRPPSARSRWPLRTARTLSPSATARRSPPRAFLLTGTGSGDSAGAVSGGTLSGGANELVLAANQAGDKLTVSSTIDSTSTGGVTQAGLGKVVLTGTNSYTGATSAAAGILQIGNGTSGSLAAAYAGNFSDGGAIVFDLPAASTTYSGNVTGCGRDQPAGEHCHSDRYQYLFRHDDSRGRGDTAVWQRGNRCHGVQLGGGSDRPDDRRDRRHHYF